MTTSKEFIFSDETPKVDLGGGMVRQVLGYNQELMVVKVWFAAGTEGYVHSHVHSQVAYIAKGVFDVNLGGVIKRMKEGDSFFVPPYVEHGAVCIEEGILIDTFSPYREDFLEAKV